MRHSVMLFLIVASLFLYGFSRSMMNAKAAVSTQPEYARYYTSICIREGDSLWSIASRFKENSTMTTSEYIEELKRMNRLHDETIHAGQYLTVVYFK